MTIPPPFGSGNLNRMNRPAMQFSTAEEPMVEDFTLALETEPSLAMTNLMTILPPSAGSLLSSR